ncbi:dimeric alpha+beta barrel [Fusarium tjaetaba]|uniref:Dimeric alpha+beta barrel n=1 Tax=Fusarium tjaetaba TaxID=1567544 RepID=A0A8H5W3N7_9HYPO|nr:dimeric alpha+beta barrel [Fusarium tjaetaba]KAF5647852.1 dimeric alpha+beta barrel [Fusarium tjaetaba]
MAKIVRITFLLRKRGDLVRRASKDMAVCPHRQAESRYSQFHADEKLDLSGTGMPPVAPFDGAATMWAKSLEDLHAIFSDPEYNRIVVPDEEKFLKRAEAVPIIGWDEVKFVKEGLSGGTE